MTIFISFIGLDDPRHFYGKKIEEVFKLDKWVKTPSNMIKNQ